MVVPYHHGTTTIIITMTMVGEDVMIETGHLRPVTIIDSRTTTVTAVAETGIEIATGETATICATTAVTTIEITEIIM